MKVITTHTKFEFNKGEREAIKTVNNLIDLIYNAIEEDEVFLDLGAYEMQDVSEFFDRFEKLMEQNGGFIECTDLP